MTLEEQLRKENADLRIDLARLKRELNRLRQILAEIGEYAIVKEKDTPHGKT